MRSRESDVRSVVRADELAHMLLVVQRQLQRLGLGRGAHLHRPPR